MGGEKQSEKRREQENFEFKAGCGERQMAGWEVRREGCRMRDKDRDQLLQRERRVNFDSTSRR